MTRRKKKGNELWWLVPVAAVVVIILVANAYRVGVGEMKNYSDRIQQRIEQ